MMGSEGPQEGLAYSDVQKTHNIVGLKRENPKNRVPLKSQRLDWHVQIVCDR